MKKRGVEIDRVIGIDEAGRGPLAGPVVVAGVILPKKHGIKGLNDSKLLTEKRREELFELIMERAHLAPSTGSGFVTGSGRCAEVFVEMASNVVIDKKGILVCTKQLMRRIVIDSGAKMALVDAESVPNVRDVIQMGVTKGDQKVDCIAAASIIAKVTRDRMMLEMDRKYPGYGLADHKGYGTEKHRKAIGELGLSKVHRKSFLSV